MAFLEEIRIPGRMFLDAVKQFLRVLSLPPKKVENQPLQNGGSIFYGLTPKMLLKLVLVPRLGH
jgi:hypothetical protein